MTENAARPNEAEWRELLEHSPLMYFVVDVSGRVRFSERVGAAELGYHVDELVGQSVFEVFPDSDRERVRRNVDLCLERPGQLNTWEARKIRKDGTTLWVGESQGCRAGAGRRGRPHSVRRHHLAQARRRGRPGKRKALSRPDRARLRRGAAAGP